MVIVPSFFNCSTAGLIQLRRDSQNAVELRGAFRYHNRKNRHYNYQILDRKGIDVKPSKPKKNWEMSRRDFLQTAGTTAAGISLSYNQVLGTASLAQADSRQKAAAIVRGAFIYPPTESLRKIGYYSWPGSTFDAEGTQKRYAGRIKRIKRNLGMRISMNDKPLDDEAGVTRFINEVKQSGPDGLLLIPFKKGHWKRVTRIIEETAIPTVVLATLGVLLVDHINQLHRKPGVYMISSLDNLDAVEYGMKMIRTARWMKNSLIASIPGPDCGTGWPRPHGESVSFPRHPDQR